MFHAFLRIDEVTASRNNILLVQISVQRACVVIVFYRAKHLVGPPILISVPASGGRYCPVANLKAFLAVRGTAQGPLFCLPDLKAISSTQFNTWLVAALSHGSLSSLPIKSHSFRIGAATYAATVGYTEAQIQKMGRWKSGAFRKYSYFIFYNSVMFEALLLHPPLLSSSASACRHLTTFRHRVRVSRGQVAWMAAHLRSAVFGWVCGCFALLDTWSLTSNSFMPYTYRWTSVPRYTVL